MCENGQNSSGSAEITYFHQKLRTSTNNKNSPRTFIYASLFMNRTVSLCSRIGHLGKSSGLSCLAELDDLVQDFLGVPVEYFFLSDSLFSLIVY